MVLDVIVIGASQAGLAMGYFLKQKGVSFAILGRESRLGDIWRKRYDSLELFTPRWLSALPGMALPGDPKGYATKDEIADYLEQYAIKFYLPVHLQVDVHRLEKRESLFTVTTSKGEYVARQVVVATGPYQKAFIPSFADLLSKEVYQVHTAAYQHPQQLHNGSVLIVGAGNSGAQIAVELTKTREVFLSVGHPLKFFPLEILGKSIFYWLKMMGIYSLTANTALGKRIMRQGDPIMGKALKKAIIEGKVKLKPRAIKSSGGAVSFTDGTQIEVKNIIWATGFTPDYHWLNIPEAFDGKGLPIHERGVSPVGGLFFLGLPWQHTRGSALIGGVGADAEYLAGLIHEINVKEQVVTSL